MLKCGGSNVGLLEGVRFFGDDWLISLMFYDFGLYLGVFFELLMGVKIEVFEVNDYGFE